MVILMHEVVLNLLIADHSDQTDMLILLLGSIQHVEVISTVNTAKDYIEEMTRNPHINAVLLDEDLDTEMRGSEAYNLLRLRGRNVPTILMTNRLLSASYIADLEITDILEKPFTLERLNIGLKKQRMLIKQMQFMASGGLFVPVVSDQIKLFTPDEILFIESINRIVYVHVRDLVMESKIPIKLYEKYLMYNDFVLTHRSCLINLHQVKDIENNTIRFKHSKQTAVITEDKKSSFSKQLHIFLNKRA